MNDAPGLIYDVFELAESLSRPGEILGGQSIKFPLLEERFIAVFIKYKLLFKKETSFLRDILQKEFPQAIICVGTRDEKPSYEEQGKHLSLIVSGGKVWEAGP